MRTRPRFKSAAVVALAVTIAACDSDSPIETPPPDGTPALEFISGHVQEDTVFSGPADSLVLRIARPDGEGVPGIVVRLHAVRGATITPHVYLVRDGRQHTTLEDTTDAGGRVAAQIAFGGPNAGQALLEIEVPHLGTTDSVWYTVLTGVAVEPARAVSPADTALVIGAEVELRVIRRDRHGNDVHVPPTSCTSATAVIDVLPPCTLRGRSFGTGEVPVEHGEFSREIEVPVLPPATFAVALPEKLFVREMDGTLLHVFEEARAVDWAPSGEEMVVSRGDEFGRGASHLYVQDLSGASSALIPSFAGSLGEEAPQYSQDGRWVYFSARVTEGTTEVWRVRVGGAPERVGPVASTGERHESPSPAPDASAVAYAFTGPEGRRELRVIDQTTGQVRTLDIPATFVRWSPTGDWLAVQVYGATGFGGRLALVRPDGSGLRDLGAEGRMDWSPDGRYLIVGGRNPGIVHVESGERVNFPAPYFFPAAGSAAWRP